MRPTDINSLFANVVKTELGCIEFGGYIDGKGYGNIGFRATTWKAHRVSYTLCTGEIPPEMLVLHRCDNPKCINPEHLFLGNHNDNVQDMIDKDRAKVSHPGSQHPNAKVDESDVIEMRRLYDNGLATIAEIANKYRLTWRPAQLIVTGQAWRHI